VPKAPAQLLKMLAQFTATGSSFNGEFNSSV
jgi:hypothetical protein